DRADVARTDEAWGCAGSSLHVDALELDDQCLVGAPFYLVKIGRRRSRVAVEFAQRDERQPLAGALEALRADVNGIVELEINRRDNGRVRDSLRNAPLDFLHTVPVFARGIVQSGETADLDKVER